MQAIRSFFSRQFWPIDVAWSIARRDAGRNRQAHLIAVRQYALSAQSAPLKLKRNGMADLSRAIYFTKFTKRLDIRKRVPRNTPVLSIFLPARQHAGVTRHRY